MNSDPQPWWVAPAVIAALVAAGVAIATLIVNGRRARLDRQRELFAGVFGDLTSYCEFPYIVRRRRKDEPDAERVRISTELSEVQRLLNRHRAVLRVEAPRVASAYGDLLDATRRIAGAAIHDGWDAVPGESAHVADVDLSGIDPYTDAYLQATRDHLSIWPTWIRGLGRRVRRRDRPNP